MTALWIVGISLGCLLVATIAAAVVIGIAKQAINYFIGRSR
jgi:hypothetical protein